MYMHHLAHTQVERFALSQKLRLCIPKFFGLP